MPTRLKQLNILWRLGITAVLAVFAIGLAAATAHLWYKYENRDERPGLTIDDVKAQYSGINTPSALLASLQANHPAELKAPQREELIKWLTGPKVAEQYDSTEFGPQSPYEIIASNCLSCHSRSAKGGTQPLSKPINLDYWDDVKKLAISRQINPAPVNIKANSTHAHAPSMATMTVAIALLLLMTRWWRLLTGLLVAAAGIGLLADIGGWWLAADNANFAYMIVAGGATYMLSTGVQLLLILVDLWLPGGRGDNPKP